MKRAICKALLLGLCVRPAAAQLAITEVMSSASTCFGCVVVTNGPDFFELTNFSTNQTDTIDLAGYQYADSASLPLVLLVQPGVAPLSIRPGESAVFVRTDVRSSVTNETQFRDWWGPCLSSNVQVRMVPRTPGFDRFADGVRLFDPNGNLLDSVDFGIAQRGVTFVYDTNTGGFGTYSELGVCGACQASQSDDIGSPGVSCGPVPLRIFSQPTNLSVCAGAEATFTIKAWGLPRPRYQWFFNRAPIPGAVAAAWTVTNATPVDAGSYAVEVNNGAAILRSAAAQLSVSTNPSAPIVLEPPSDLSVITEQTARFSVRVCAFPSPTFQWCSNHVAIAEATNWTLVIRNCPLSLAGTEYCVAIQNALGSTSVCARLTVTLPPKLEVTEIMPAAGGCDKQDWVEVSNRGTNAVNLLGYRFSDRFTFEAAHVVTEPMILQAGQSGILVERLSPEEFVHWWGAERLPPGLPIFTYSGATSFSAMGGELYLWSPAAEDVFDANTIFSCYASATAGVSLEFDPEYPFGQDSVPGERGAFAAEECGDIGSPGYTSNPPPRFVSITKDASGVALRWRAILGKSYLLKCKSELTERTWTNLRTVTATNWVGGTTDPTPGNAVQRFYLLEEQP